MKRFAAIALLLGLIAGAGCGRGDEPTRFTPPPAAGATERTRPADRSGPPGRTAPARNIEMH